MMDENMEKNREINGYDTKMKWAATLISDMKMRMGKFEKKNTELKIKSVSMEENMKSAEFNHKVTKNDMQEQQKKFDNTVFDLEKALTN